MDKMSSAHVYLRLRKGQTIDDISEGVLEDCVQLVKANSIQGKVSEPSFNFTWFRCLCFYAWTVFEVAFPLSLWICYFMILNKKLNVCLMIESWNRSLNKAFLFVLNMETGFNELVVLSRFSFKLQATR